MSEHIHKRHNKTLLLYHIVCPLKYRKGVITKEIGEALKEICLEISERYEIHFIEVGYESNHVHFLVQSVPKQSPTQIITTVKSLTAREIFKKHPEVKQQLWGGEFWTDGYFVNTVSKFGDETSITKYVRDQGVTKDYTVLHSDTQLTLF